MARLAMIIPYHYTEVLSIASEYLSIVNIDVHGRKCFVPHLFHLFIGHSRQCASSHTDAIDCKKLLGIQNEVSQPLLLPHALYIVLVAFNFFSACSSPSPYCSPESILLYITGELLLLCPLSRISTPWSCSALLLYSIISSRFLLSDVRARQFNMSPMFGPHCMDIEANITSPQAKYQHAGIPKRAKQSTAGIRWWSHPW
jgi:hypothetical protein